LAHSGAAPHFVRSPVSLDSHAKIDIPIILCFQLELRPFSQTFIRQLNLLDQDWNFEALAVYHEARQLEIVHIDGMGHLTTKIF
jgi:hypothetical protein